MQVLRRDSNGNVRVSMIQLTELFDAASQLLAWQPCCSLGSSDDLRQKRLKKAIEEMVVRV